MSRAIRLHRLRPPPLENLPDLLDERTSAASRPGNCESCAMGHHSHWIPMRKAGKDPEGNWGTVTRLFDDGLDVLLDSGATLSLRHHDMAADGGVLAQHRRAWLQLKWGWLWVDGIGISVASASRYPACSR